MFRVSIPELELRIKSHTKLLQIKLIIPALAGAGVVNIKTDLFYLNKKVSLSVFSYSTLVLAFTSIQKEHQVATFTHLSTYLNINK